MVLNDVIWGSVFYHMKDQVYGRMVGLVERDEKICLVIYVNPECTAQVWHTESIRPLTEKEKGFSKEPLPAPFERLEREI